MGSGRNLVFARGAYFEWIITEVHREDLSMNALLMSCERRCLKDASHLPLAKSLLRWCYRHFRNGLCDRCILPRCRRVLIDSGCLRDHRQCATNDHTEGQDKQIVGDELQIDSNPCKDEYRYLKTHVDKHAIRWIHAIITPKKLVKRWITNK